MEEQLLQSRALSESRERLERLVRLIAYATQETFDASLHHPRPAQE